MASKAISKDCPTLPIYIKNKLQSNYINKLTNSHVATGRQNKEKSDINPAIITHNEKNKPIAYLEKQRLQQELKVLRSKEIRLYRICIKDEGLKLTKMSNLICLSEILGNSFWAEYHGKHIRMMQCTNMIYLMREYEK